MRRIVTALFGIGFVVTAGATTLAAQVRGYVGAGTGVAFALGDFNDNAEVGWVVHAVGGFASANGVIGARVNGSFARHSNQLVDGNTRFVGAMADFVVSPGAGAKLRPYFLGGAGFKTVRTEAPLGTNSETKFALNGGAGFTIRAGDRFSLFLEGRFLSVQSDPSANTLPVTLGVRIGGQ